MSSTGAKNLLQGDDNGHVGRPCEVSLAPPCPELFLRVTGPLPSIVLRTEDMWHKRKNQSHRSGGVLIRVSKETLLPLNVHWCSVSSTKMLKTVHSRCVMRMRMSTIDVGMRLGDAIDPCHLANGFEAVIGYECQERSNHPFSHSYDAYNTCKVLQSK